jgi:hypothetical protein
MPKYTPTQYSPPYTGKQELRPAELEIYKKAEAAAQEATKEARAKYEMHKKEDAIKALLAKSKGGSRRRRAQKSSRKSSKRAFRKKSRRMH